MAISAHKAEWEDGTAKTEPLALSYVSGKVSKLIQEEYLVLWRGYLAHDLTDISHY